MHSGNILEDVKISGNVAVYPCAYREHAETLQIAVVAIGLSLCIQGTFTINNFSLRPCRFIPVHTGTMDVRYCVEVTTTVYPCAYREHRLHSMSFGYKPGLSLCIQGTCFIFFVSSTILRFIPVHTGNIVC